MGGYLRLPNAPVSQMSSEYAMSAAPIDESDPRLILRLI